MSLDPIDDDITDDLTIDGTDLLAELRAAHGRQANVDPDELTIDGAALLEEIKAAGSHDAVPSVAQAPEPPQRPAASAVASQSDPPQGPARSAAEGSDSSEATLARWSPPATRPESDVAVEPRAGKASRVQMVVIAAVVVAALAIGGWAMRDVLQEAPADAGDSSENTSGDGSTDVDGRQDSGGFGG